MEEAAAHLSGRPSRWLHGLAAADERCPREDALDGRLLEAIAARATGGIHGSVYTSSEEGRILAAFALAAAAARRGGPTLVAGVAGLLGASPCDPALPRALDGLRVLDPCCGGGSLLVAAWRLASAIGARLVLQGMDVSAVAARAAALRLELLGADAELLHANALFVDWPPCDLLLANPPFVRHESLLPDWKAQAVGRSGLPRRADLSAHLVLLALRHAPVCGLVLPRALGTSRSAAPLRDEAAERGGFLLSLRSRAAGSFAASVETSLSVWVEGGASLPAAEATVPLRQLSDAELSGLAAGRGGRRICLARLGGAHATRSRPRARPLSDLCEVRFGLKSGANGFFHLRPLGGDRYHGELAGEVRLEPGDVAPLLAGLRDAVAPEVARVTRVIFRPLVPSEAARDYLRLGESLGVDRRPSCAARRTWWRIVPGREPAPVLYPAKVGTRAFAFHNRDRLLEDKKWLALFPREVEPWATALLLSASPLRLAIERGARQLTGAQAIADIDAGVLAAIPFPDPGAIGRHEGALRELHTSLASDPVGTDVAAVLARPAQRELDRLAGELLGLGAAAVERGREELVRHVSERLARGHQVRRAIAGRE